MSDLWTEASRDVEAEGQALATSRAQVALAEMWPFFALAKSKVELEHRKALAVESLRSIASVSGLGLPDLASMIDRHYDLLVQASMAKTAEEEEEGGKQFYIVDKATSAKVAGPFDDRKEAEEKLHDNDSGLPEGELEIEAESSEPEEEEGEEKEASLRTALTEGENILAETVDPAPGYGTPEKPSEHDDGPDANIPADAMNRIPDAVASMKVIVDLTAEAGRLLSLLSSKKTAGIEDLPDTPGGEPQPDNAGGEPPEGPDAPGEFNGPPAATAYPETTKPRQMPDGGDPQGGDPMMDVGSGGQMGSDPDPVGDQVDQVTASVRLSNPQLDEQTCRRVARKVVGRYLVTAAADDGIVYAPSQRPRPQEEEEGEPKERGLGEHAMDSAAGGAVMKAAPALLEELPLLAI
jgi:hypothetical protein